MRIVFFGTPQFSADILRFLKENGCDVVATVTRVDKPRGRGRKCLSSPVKVQASALDVPCLQALSAATLKRDLERYRPDLFLVVAFGEILSKEILDVPRLASVNLHTSLLPKYRGAAPIQRCLMHGDEETGVSIIRMEQKMDAGPILKMVKVGIDPDDTFGTLEAKLLEVGSKALLDVVHDYEKGVVQETEQDHERATFAPKIQPKDCLIDWSKTALENHHLIRALSPRPGAWAWVQFKGQNVRLKILKSIVSQEGALQPILVQLEGKKPMLFSDLLLGNPIEFIK